MESGMNLSLEGRSCFRKELLGNWDGLRVDAEEEREQLQTLLISDSAEIEKAFVYLIKKNKLQE